MGIRGYGNSELDRLSDCHGGGGGEVYPVRIVQLDSHSTDGGLGAPEWHLYIESCPSLRRADMEGTLDDAHERGNVSFLVSRHT